MSDDYLRPDELELEQRLVGLVNQLEASHERLLLDRLREARRQLRDQPLRIARALVRCDGGEGQWYSCIKEVLGGDILHQAFEEQEAEQHAATA